MCSNEIIDIVKKGNEVSFKELKVSYLIFKPNANKHYGDMLKTIKERNFEIIAQYGILDYETVNMGLHKTQTEAIKYLIPISRMFQDFFGNYAILIIVAKRNISYENFCLQVLELKKYLRNKYDRPYIAYAFNTSLIGQKNEHQRIIIQDVNGKAIPKNRFNEEGTYMLFFINEVHSPDEHIENLQLEMQILYDMGIISEENKLNKRVESDIKKYHTFEFIRDIL